MLVQTAIDSLNIVRDKCGVHFESSDWTFYVSILSGLFVDTTPSFLNEYNLEQEDECVEIREEE